ncbi:MAG: hypothetical protein JKX94_03045 [Sneathiella sp.]|nr:hypothetical protein [Sneathiella sp.]
MAKVQDFGGYPGLHTKMIFTITAASRVVLSLSTVIGSVAGPGSTFLFSSLEISDGMLRENIHLSDLELTVGINFLGSVM